MQRLAEQQAKRREEERAAAIQRSNEEARKKEDEKKAKEEAYRNDFIPKLKIILKQNDVEIDNDKFARFIQTHNNWLRNSYIMGIQDFIMVAKYKNS